MDKNKNEIKNYFFVDFENVNPDCLTGLPMLGKNDRVRIYYGKNAAHLPFETHIQIMNCGAVFEYVKVEFAIKNALDCMILYDISNMSQELKVGSYFIVSKDSDFDEPIKLFRGKGIKIFKIGEIKSFHTVAEAEKKASATKQEAAKTKASKPEEKKSSKAEKSVAEALSGTPYSKESAFIAKCVTNASNKGVLNRQLQSKFDGKQVKEIFKLLKSIIKEMPTH